jgi:uncharacterized protein (TIGR02284 family)
MKSLMILLTLSLVTTACGTINPSKEKTDQAKMEAKSHSKLDDVIRGEMAAVETYSQVIDKVESREEKEELRAIRDNHKDAVTKLQRLSNRPVKDDATDSGAWGTFARAWTGGAKLFGEKSAVRALKRGEEHGIREYEKLLTDEKISNEIKEVVRSELLPKQREHISTLESKI